MQGSSSPNVRHFGPDELDGTITNLIPGQTYAFEIEARTKIGSGRVKYWEQKMPIEGELLLFLLVTSTVTESGINPRRNQRKFEIYSIRFNG